MLYRNNHFPLT